MDNIFANMCMMLLVGYAESAAQSLASVLTKQKQNGWYSFYSQWEMQYFKIVSALKCVWTFIVRNVHFIFIIFVHWMFTMFSLFVITNSFCPIGTAHAQLSTNIEKKRDGSQRRRHDTAAKTRPPGSQTERYGRRCFFVLIVMKIVLFVFFCVHLVAV